MRRPPREIVQRTAKVTRTLKFFERPSTDPKLHRWVCVFYFAMPVLHQTHIFIGEYGSDLFTFGTKTYPTFTMQGVKTIYCNNINRQCNKKHQLDLKVSIRLCECPSRNNIVTALQQRYQVAKTLQRRWRKAL